ncbi:MULTISPECIES: hypothetical protein [Stenotrophomonas]|uniref:hypothetical protein n=1 Tax=Stenotrophomonas TaxID=40323 RepID=UPI0008734520|nr:MULTISPECIES: hypothetical protein [Stenotrophomonas]OEZ00476.1 hypothetical protein BIY45_11525 [Stenotrophomonas sp. BIIR7]
MSAGTRRIKSDLRDFAGEVMRELQSRQTVQSFNGTLRVNPDRVVISEVEGRRVIEKLRQRLK